MTNNGFNKNDNEILVQFLIAKGCLPKDSEKKFDFEFYPDGQNMVVLAYKKRGPILKNVLSPKMTAKFEIRASEDYSVLRYNVNVENSMPEYVVRDIYYPHFKEEYMAKKAKNETSPTDNQMGM